MSYRGIARYVTYAWISAAMPRAPVAMTNHIVHFARSLALVSVRSVNAFTLSAKSLAVSPTTWLETSAPLSPLTMVMSAAICFSTSSAMPRILAEVCA